MNKVTRTLGATLLAGTIAIAGATSAVAAPHGRDATPGQSLNANNKGSNRGAGGIVKSRAPHGRDATPGQSLNANNKGSNRGNGGIVKSRAPHGRDATPSANKKNQGRH